MEKRRIIITFLKNSFPGMGVKRPQALLLMKMDTEKHFQFEKIYKTYCRQLHAYAFTMLNDSILAEEAVQEVFIRMWNRNKEQAVHTAIKAYLYAAVHNQCLLELKRTKRKAGHLQAITQRSMQTKNTNDASMKIMHAELERKYRDALNTLPSQCRTIFQLSRFEKLKYQEVASELGLSVKTVENQMGKALKILRSSLAEFLPLLIFILCY